MRDELLLEVLHDTATAVRTALDALVVLDPVDGSTNASRGLPWFATSLCAVDADGARAAVVVDQAGGTRVEAVRGRGARVDGPPAAPGAGTGVGPLRGGGGSARRLHRLLRRRARVGGLPGGHAGLPGGWRAGRRCLRPPA